MTSHEVLAIAAVGLPALVAAAIAVVPRRVVTAFAVVAAVPASAPALALSVWILHAPDKPSVGKLRKDVIGGRGRAERADRTGRHGCKNAACIPQTDDAS